MTFHHNFATPRIIAPGGPVSRAIRTLRNADPKLARIRDLRQAIEDRIEADIALLDALVGDADLEPSLAAPEFKTWLPHAPWARGSTDERENAECEDCDGDPCRRRRARPRVPRHGTRLPASSYRLPAARLPSPREGAVSLNKGRKALFRSHSRS